MHISLSPQVRHDRLTLSKSGDVLTINGEQFDFSGIPDGGEIDTGKIPCDFIAGEKVERIDGELHLTLILPHDYEGAPRSVRFPEPITVTNDGPVTLPGDDNVEA